MPLGHGSGREIIPRIGLPRRLRKLGNHIARIDSESIDAKLLLDAADEIERLRDREDKYRLALAYIKSETGRVEPPLRDVAASALKLGECDE